MCWTSAAWQTRNRLRRPLGWRDSETHRGAKMTGADLDMRAELTIWPSRGPASTAEGKTFPTLREALAAAAEAIEADGA
ncbi:MAG: DUF2867 domain-containing protein [Parafilimonas terrae]|nr:DUF2867 domain-containing protein [Parafilimonas terrae]